MAKSRVPVPRSWADDDDDSACVCVCLDRWIAQKGEEAEKREHLVDEVSNRDTGETATGQPRLDWAGRGRDGPDSGFDRQADIRTGVDDVRCSGLGLDLGLGLGLGAGRWMGWTDRCWLGLGGVMDEMGLWGGQESNGTFTLALHCLGPWATTVSVTTLSVARRAASTRRCGSVGGSFGRPRRYVLVHALSKLR